MAHVPAIRAADSGSAKTESRTHEAADTAQAQPAGRVFAYKRVGGLTLELEVFFPPKVQASVSATAIAAGTQTEPLRSGLLLFHGGGWRSGTRDKLAFVCRYFADRGMVAATADYRMHARDAVLPAGESYKRLCVTDAKSAIRWMKQHAADLGIDPRRIALGGGSAGAHIAVLAAINTAGLDDPADPRAVDTTAAAFLLLNPAFAEKEPDAAVNPLGHLTSGFAPTMALFGTDDRWLPGWRKVRDRLKDLGNTTEELWTARGGIHGFYLTPPWRDLVLRQADDFFVRLGLLRERPSAPVLQSKETLERVP